MRKIIRQISVIILILTGLYGSAWAGQVKVPFGSVKHDIKQQIEIVSDSFTLSQNRGSAVFDGNVVVGQGDIRMSASKIIVEYAQTDGKPNGKIGRMIASGGVTLVSGAEAVEAQKAVYSPATGTIVMEGKVLLTTGDTTLAGEKIIIDLKDGSAKVEGRVKTIFKASPSK